MITARVSDSTTFACFENFEVVCGSVEDSFICFGVSSVFTFIIVTD